MKQQDLPVGFREALAIAQEAHEELFASRRGVGSFTTRHVYLYDNNPYASDAGLRERELAELKLALAAHGIKVAAVARYPLVGEEAEYTLAIVFDLGTFAGNADAGEQLVKSEWSRVLLSSQEGDKRKDIEITVTRIFGGTHEGKA